MLEQVSTLSLRDQVRRALTDAVLSGELKPGKRVNETALAAQLNVSQTPVREALLGLESKGLVESKPRQGFYVRPFRAEEMRELYPVLASLEEQALREAGLPDERGVKRIAAANEKLKKAAGSVEKAVEQDSVFHQRLLEHCTNGYLMQLVERTRELCCRYEYAYMREGHRVAGSAEQHDAIVESLRGGDLDAACRHLRENLHNGLEQIEEWLLTCDES